MKQLREFSECAAHVVADFDRLLVLIGGIIDAVVAARLEKNMA